MKIVQMTTVHHSTDTRIFYKECKTLASAGNEVILVVQNDKDEIIDGIQIRALSKPINRLDRMTRLLWQTYRIAIKENADAYHFHDPEIIPVGILLKLRGKRVVYDVHEDAPRQTLDKYWINPALRKLIAWFMEGLEWVAGKTHNGIVAATPKIARRFPSSKTLIVQNFPIVNELVPESIIPYKERPHFIVYIGLLSPLRGAKEMIKALGLLPEHLQVRLRLAGSFMPENIELEEQLKQLPGWKRVEFLGWKSRPEVAAILGNSKLGLVLFHPIPNHIMAQPCKLFEYMSAGIPVIASHFPLWREIIEKSGCGLLVDPRHPKAIAEAIQWLLEHPEEAELMGKRGRTSVEAHYKWEWEAEKLVRFYLKILQ